MHYKFVERNKRSIVRMQKDYNSAVLVAGHNRFELYRQEMKKPFFFHPNSAAYRMKRLLKGGTDPLIDVSELKEGDSFLDCTLGLASDSIIASFAVGENGRVLGLEGDKDIAFIVEKGLQTFPTSLEEMHDAMRRVVVKQINAISFLENEQDCSWDVVYIDPMFSAPIDESSNFTPLRQVGLLAQLSEKWIEEAYRVCKRRVIVKEHFNSPVFEQFKFQQIVRPNTKFHFGYLSKV
ncbi:class I SAM-dependent methyltransferase [Sporosarcina pasteurii]|nr:class I SAM-dependent methyltransferase [Sporosarcina pasteurii]MDS9471243.1 class I SAM-dependent methyltransferase [Sporosarcina pasteurii]